MKALIDGDIFVYRAGFGAQSKSKDIPVSHSLHNVRSMLRTTVRTLRQYFNIETVSIFLTSDDKSNFRFDVATVQEYKGNRTQPKPIHYNEIRQYLIDKFNAEVIYEEEADDAIGKRSAELLDKCVIVSADKDLRMLPGWHWEMGDRTPYYSTEFGFLQLEKRKGGRSQLFGTGQCWFYAQCLMGDKADNIPGVRRCGDVKAFNALKDCKSVEELNKKVLDIYLQEGYTESRLNEIKELLWIRR